MRGNYRYKRFPNKVDYQNDFNVKYIVYEKYNTRNLNVCRLRSQNFILDTSLGSKSIKSGHNESQKILIFEK